VDLVTAAAQNRSQGPVAQGILPLVGFGIGWAVVGAIGLTSPGPARVAGVVVAVLVGLAVAVVALRSPRGDIRRHPGSANPGREFVLVNAGQAVLILVAVLVCVAVGAPVLIAPAVCLAVGLHFLPLSRIFGLPLYRTTGAILAAVALIGFGLFAAGASDDAVLVLVGLAAAVTLWCTSLLLPHYA
jgi:hypothetical protein